MADFIAFWWRALAEVWRISQNVFYAVDFPCAIAIGVLNWRKNHGRAKKWEDYGMKVALFVLLVSVVISILAAPYLQYKFVWSQLHPDVSLQLTFDRPVSADTEPELMQAVANSRNIMRMTYLVPEGNRVATVEMEMSHFLFELNITNNGDSSCYLNTFRISECATSYPYGGNSGQWGAVATFLTDERKASDTALFVNLGPHQTKTVNLILSQFIIPTADCINAIKTSGSDVSGVQFVFTGDQRGLNAAQADSHYNPVGPTCFLPRQDYLNRYVNRGVIKKFQMEAFSGNGAKFDSNEIQNVPEYIQ